MGKTGAVQMPEHPKNSTFSKLNTLPCVRLHRDVAGGGLRNPTIPMPIAIRIAAAR